MYLFTKHNETINAFDIYQSLTLNEKMDLTQNKLNQYFANVESANANGSEALITDLKTKFKQIPNDKVYSYKEFITLFSNIKTNIEVLINKPFGNFHSESSTSHDYKIRYALQNTQFLGGYMTDIIKDFEEKVSCNLMKYINNNPLFLQENIKSFEEEIKTIGSVNPILIAFGNDCYKILITNLKTKYKIYKISHYSSCINKEKLRIEIENIIKEL